MALAELQKLRSEVNKLLERGLSTEGRQRSLSRRFVVLGGVLGLFQLDDSGSSIRDVQVVRVRRDHRVDQDTRKICKTEDVSETQ